MKDVKPQVIEDPLMTIVVNESGISFQPSQALIDVFGSKIVNSVFYKTVERKSKGRNKKVQDGKQE